MAAPRSGRSLAVQSAAPSTIVPKQGVSFPFPGISPLLHPLWNGRLLRSRLNTNTRERQELFIVPDSDEVPAQQKIYVSVTWASTCPGGPRPGSGVMFCPCSCAELMPTWLNNLLAPVFCPKVLNLVTTPLLPSPLSVRNKYFWTWNKY